MQITVKYVAGSYVGERTVEAVDGTDAKCQVRAWVHRNITLAMYSEGYRVVSVRKEIK